MKERFGVDETTDPSASVLNDAYDDLASGLKKVMFGLATLEDVSYENHGKYMETGIFFRDPSYKGCIVVPVVSGNMDLITESMQEFEKGIEIKDKIENIIDDFGIATSSLTLAINSEYSGRYEYFKGYINYRKQFGYNYEESFGAALSGIQVTETDNNVLGGFVKVITGGKKGSWKDHMELIEDWAEYTYQLQEAVYNFDTKDSAQPVFQNYTHNQIQCPVDVDILDENGNSIASIKNNQITQEVPSAWNDKVFVTVSGDAKHIFINNGTVVTIRLTGTDEGEMNYSSSSVKNGTEIIVNNTFDVPISKGSQYSISYQNESAAETSYARLIKEEEEEIPVSSSSKQEYPVNVRIDGNGLVYGDKSYREGTNVILQAIASDGSYFKHWKNDEGKVVSTNPFLQFTMRKDVSLTAVFTDEKVKEGQNKPVGISAGDGCITGTTKSMEYSLAGQELWKDCTEKSTYVKPGSYNVRMKETDDKEASDSVMVTVTIMSASGISLDQTSLDLTEGGTTTLKAMTEPEGTTDKILWNSENPEVASVEDGVVTAKKAGKTIIRAKAGKQVATCTVTVKAKPTTPITPSQPTTSTLDNLKATAKADLARYANPDAYRPAQREELRKAIEAGNKTIDAAKDKNDFDAALKKAKASIDSIKTDAQITAEEKKSAKEKAEAEKKAAEEKAAEERAEAEKKAAEEKAAKEKAEAEKKAAENQAAQETGKSNGVPSNMATAEQATETLTNLNQDEIIGSPYRLLQTQTISQTKKSVRISWKKVKGATKYILYGNKCGRSNHFNKIKTTTQSSVNIKKLNKKALKKGTYYKFIVLAVDNNGNVLATSKSIHVATKGGKYTNVKKVTILNSKAAKKALSKLKAGTTYTIKIKQTKASEKLMMKNHRNVKFESSDKNIATVNSKGKIKGIKQGTCYIYVYAQDGVMTRIKATVK